MSPLRKHTPLHELAVLVRQHEVSGSSPGRLERLLGAEIRRAHALNLELRPRLRRLRHVPSALMVRCDEAVARAQNAFERRDFAETLRSLKEARRWLACLGDLLADATEFEAAGAEYNSLLNLLGSEYLSGLPSVVSVADLLGEADALLAAGAAVDSMLAAARGRQARFIAGLCRERLRALVSASEDPRQAEQLAARVRTQEEYRARTSAVAPAPSADGAMTRSFERLRALLAERRLALLARLTEDIEAELASRRAAFAALKSYQGLRGEAEEELRRAVGEGSWGRAATHLLGRAMKALSGEAVLLREAAREAARRWDETKQAGEAVIAAAGSSKNLEAQERDVEPIADQRDFELNAG